MCGRIARAKVYHRRAHEVTGAVQPCPALPAVSRQLPVSDEPVALRYPFPVSQFGSEVRVGRSGFGNDPNHRRMPGSDTPLRRTASGKVEQAGCCAVREGAEPTGQQIPKG